MAEARQLGIFASSISIRWCRMAKITSANMVGHVSTDGYTFDESASVVNGEFVGLAIDEDNESDRTDGRIAAWVETIRPEL